MAKPAECSHRTEYPVDTSLLFNLHHALLAEATRILDDQEQSPIAVQQHPLFSARVFGADSSPVDTADRDGTPWSFAYHGMNRLGGDLVHLRKALGRDVTRCDGRT